MPSGRDRSLKRDGVRWTGEDHRSALEPLIEQFVLLENCYVTGDGTDISRIPGWVAVGKPRFAETYAVGTWTEGNPTRLVFGSNHFLTTGDKIEVVGATGSGASLVNKEHTVTWITATTVDLPVDTTALVLNDGVGTVYVDRLRHIHGFKQVIGRTMICVEEKGRIDQIAAAIIQDVILGNPVLIILDRPHGYEVGSTFSVTIAGTVANYTADIRGGHTATSWSPYGFTIPVNVSVAPEPGQDSIALIDRETVAFTAKLSTPAIYSWTEKPEIGATLPYADRWPLAVRKNIPATWGLGDLSVMHRRAALDVTAKRLLIAVPGNACCYTADVGAYDLTLLREVTALGMPKGMLRTTLQTFEDLVDPPPNMPAGTYWFAVAYRSAWSDDVGLISEPVSVTTVAPNLWVVVHFATPWEVLRECPTACQALIYWGTSSTGLRLIRILDSTEWSASGIRKGTVSWQLNFDPTTTIVPDVFRDLRVEQQPMGAKTVKTSRGFTLFGGFLGPDATGDQALLYTRALSATPGSSSLRMFTSCKMVGGQLPPSYQGTRLFNPPGKPAFVDLKTMKTYEPGTPPVPDSHIWATDSPEITTSNAFHTRSRLIPQMGLTWSSEQGFPGVTPAVYRAIVELLRGQDVEGIGRLGDHYIVATENEIYWLGFGRLPAEASPQIIMEQHGCNGSPNAMCEWDGGCVGVGSRGPWTVGRAGGFRHIGDRVEDLMPNFKRDIRGHMRHLITAHDSTRGLIWFGFRADRYDGAYGSMEATIASLGSLDDSQKGKIGCDFFLIWSHDSDTWSTWKVPKYLADVKWMEELLCDDGVKRLAFIAGSDWDAQMYVFDDAYLDGMTPANIVLGSLDPTHTGNKTTFKATTTIGTGSATKVGMDYFVTDQLVGTLRGMGRIRSIISATEVELGGMDDEAVTLTLSADDRIHIGMIHMRLRTQRWGLPPWQGSSAVSSVQARYTLDKNATGQPPGFMVPRFLESYKAAAPQPWNLPFSVAMASVPLRGPRAFSERGEAVSPEHQLELLLTSYRQITLKDITVGEEPGQ